MPLPACLNNLAVFHSKNIRATTVCVFSQQILFHTYVADTVLGAGDTVMNKNRPGSCSLVTYRLSGETDIYKIITQTNAELQLWSAYQGEIPDPHSLQKENHQHGSRWSERV